MPLFVLVMMCLGVFAPGEVIAEAFEDRSSAQQAGYTAAALVANVVPATAVTAAPRCLLGYIPCKFSLAAFSLLAAGEHLLFSGGADLQQTRAVLHRGFGGDWALTGAHMTGEAEARLLPDPPPPAPAP